MTSSRPPTPWATAACCFRLASITAYEELDKFLQDDGDGLEIVWFAGLGLLATEFDSDPIFFVAGEEFTLDGNELPSAPELAYNLAARYYVPMGDRGELAFQADYSWQDKHFLQINGVWGKPSEVPRRALRSHAGAPIALSHGGMESGMDGAQGGTRTRTPCGTGS